MATVPGRAGCAVIAALGLGLVAPLSAQEEVVATDEIVEITAEVLQRMAAVYPTVVAIAQEAEPRIAEAETEPVARALREQLEHRVKVVVASAGFSLEEYKKVVSVLNEDTELRDEFQRVLNRTMAAGDS
jgi:GTPase Era involved in 16S rRNA processing